MAARAVHGDHRTPTHVRQLGPGLRVLRIPRQVRLIVIAVPKAHERFDAEIAVTLFPAPGVKAVIVTLTAAASPPWDAVSE